MKYGLKVLTHEQYNWQLKLMKFVIKTEVAGCLICELMAVGVLVIEKKKSTAKNILLEYAHPKF